MTLRLRIALVVAAVVTVVVTVVGVMVFNAAETELIEEVDLDLLSRSRIADGPDRPEFGGPGGFPFGRRGPENDAVRFERLISTQTFARLLSRDGQFVGRVGDEFEAPTDRALLEDASEAPVLSDGTIAGERARVVTVAVGDAGFLQIARPLGEIDQSLGDLRSRIVVISTLAIVAPGIWPPARLARSAASPRPQPTLPPPATSITLSTARAATRWGVWRAASTPCWPRSARRGVSSISW